MKFVRNLRRLMRDTNGATAIEYGLILAMVFLVMIGAATALGDQQTKTFNTMSSTAAGAMAGSV